jgi:hypothetical protein
MKHLLLIIYLILIPSFINTAEKKNSWRLGTSGLGISYGPVRVGFTEIASLGLSSIAIANGRSEQTKNLSLACAATSIICNNIAYKYSFGDYALIKLFAKPGFWATAKLVLWANLFTVLIRK